MADHNLQAFRMSLKLIRDPRACLLTSSCTGSACSLDRRSSCASPASRLLISFPGFLFWVDGCGDYIANSSFGTDLFSSCCAGL